MKVTLRTSRVRPSNGRLWPIGLSLQWVMPAVCLCALTLQPSSAATYHVGREMSAASDTNAGTALAPWKTIARAAKARELQPGDTVQIGPGVYRETVEITVSGEPGRPITFAAAPGARVVIKGSEMVKGPWTRLPKDQPEPFPHAARRVWKTRLGDEFFTDGRFQASYDDPPKRWVSQVFLDDDHPLQKIGPDAIYKNDAFNRLAVIGRGLPDMIPQSFYFDAAEQMLYLDIAGEPPWFIVEVGVRGFALLGVGIHDVVIRGLEMRHNRQPGGQWPMVSFSRCERIVIEECIMRWADFSCLGLHRSTNCVVRRCDLSHGGCTGMGLGQTEDCLVEECTLLFNNYRRFCMDWGVAAGMKNIPGNRRTTVRRCEAAYNTEAEGIWFDTANEDIRILENVLHDNGDCGILFEINPGGGIIAGNLVSGNGGRGIYVSGSQNTWVVHNTVAENASGIVAMTRAKDEPPRRTCVLNNLLIRNYITAANVTRGSDLTLEMSPDPARRKDMGSVSDYNVYATNTWVPLLRHNWNDNNTLAQWQSRYNQDQHSRGLSVAYQRMGTTFGLLEQKRPEVAGPLPEDVLKIWKPRDPRSVGADLTRWPQPPPQPRR